MDEQSGPNADQIAYWNAEAGRKWAENQERMDASFGSLTEAAVAFARVAPGMRVLDVGCGCGGTTLELARAVGAGGQVTGVDISRPMLDVAERRVREAGLDQVALILADAATHDFAPGSAAPGYAADGFDLMFSRFGVMFFDNPMAAFTNIRRAIKPGGRLAFVCWRPMSDNAFFLVPWLAAKPFLPEQPPPDPTAPGPFAFADAERVRRMLRGAGFSDVTATRHDLDMRMGPLAMALDGALKIGPASRALGEMDEAGRAGTVAAIEAALRQREVDGQVVLGASVWLVGATA